MSEKIKAFIKIFFAGFFLGFGWFSFGLYWIGSAFLVNDSYEIYFMPLCVLILPSILALFWATAFLVAKFIGNKLGSSTLTIIVFLLLAGCVSKDEKAKNTIPYKYRTPEHVKMECENQMKKNLNSKAKAGSNLGNFLLGVMNGMQEDWACDPLK